MTAIFAGGERMRVRYLVGADGMHSTVREQAGIGFRTGGSGGAYSLADVRLSGGVPIIADNRAGGWRKLKKT